MTICSLVVYARPEHTKSVESELSALEGVEVHAASKEGKLVISVDHPDGANCSETIMGLHDMPGVINAALVYEYYE